MNTRRETVVFSFTSKGGINLSKKSTNLTRPDLYEKSVRLHFSISARAKEEEKLNVSPPTLFKVKLKDGGLFVFGFEKTKLLMTEQLNPFHERRLSYVSSGLYVDKEQSTEDCFKSWEDVLKGTLVETNMEVSDESGEQRPTSMEYLGVWLSKFSFITADWKFLLSYNNESWFDLWQSRRRMDNGKHDEVKEYLAANHIYFEVEQRHRHDLKLVLDERKTKEDKSRTIHYFDMNVVVRYEYPDPNPSALIRKADIYHYKIDQYGLDDNVFKVIDALYAAGLPQEPDEIRNVLRHLMMTHQLATN